MLRPLAWAEGVGLPRDDVWPAIANGRFGAGIEYRDDDIWSAGVLRTAGYHVLEVADSDRPLYRSDRSMGRPSSSTNRYESDTRDLYDASESIAGAIGDRSAV